MEWVKLDNSKLGLVEVSLPLSFTLAKNFKSILRPWAAVLFPVLSVGEFPCCIVLTDSVSGILCGEG